MKAEESIWKVRRRLRESDARSEELARAAQAYGKSLAQAGRAEEAREVCRRTLTGMDIGGADTSMGLLMLGSTLNELGASEDAERAARNALALSERLVKESPTEPKYRGLLGSSQQNLAWILATSAVPRRRDPAQAVLLAKKAVELSPTNWNCWTVLGVAQFYAGDPKAAAKSLQTAVQLNKEAIEAARKSLHMNDGITGPAEATLIMPGVWPKLQMKLNNTDGGSAYDLIFLAMAHWQLGKKVEAREWYEKAIAWTNKYSPDNEELLRFRAEAEKLLGITAPSPKKASPEPKP